MPTCPELRALLAEAFEVADPGATTIVRMAARLRENLGTHLMRIIEKAGQEIWPRGFQIPRASSATDWTERCPTRGVAKWLGHSPKVAARHCLLAKDRHFEDIVGGGEPVPVAAGGTTQCRTCRPVRGMAAAAHKKARRGHGWPGVTPHA